MVDTDDAVVVIRLPQDSSVTCALTHTEGINKYVYEKADYV